jgi:hypothetical protein
MSCLILEFNKVNRNNRFYKATLEEVENLVNQIKSENRNLLTKGFINSENSFKDALTVNLPDVIGKFENFKIIEEPKEKVDELPIIKVYADFKALNELGKAFDYIKPDVNFGLRGISLSEKNNGIKTEKIKSIICFDLI